MWIPDYSSPTDRKIALHLLFRESIPWGWTIRTNGHLYNREYLHRTGTMIPMTISSGLASRGLFG
jgi:hypothetical protein